VNLRTCDAAADAAAAKLQRPSFEIKRLLLFCSHRPTLPFLSTMPEEQGTELYTWGQGVLGQLGHGDEKPQNQPRLIVSFLGTNVKAVSCGNQHTAVLLESGEVYSFGRGNFGQLGLGSLQVRPPHLVVTARARIGREGASLNFSQTHTKSLALSALLSPLHVRPRM
jgi:hypothetical protein